MHRLLLLLIVLISTSSFCQKKTKNLPKPPNCVWLYENLTIDKTEIANIHWLEYLYYLKRDSSQNVHTEALPDTSVWIRYDTSRTKINLYLRSAEWRYYPVVGVSYQQAVDYCTWRSKIVNNMISTKDEKKWRSFEVEYRLPTEKEWEFAAAGNLNMIEFPFGYKDYYTKPNLKDLDFYTEYIKDSSENNQEHFKDQFNKYKKNDKEAIFNIVHSLPNGLLYGYFTTLPIGNKFDEKNLKLAHLKENELGVADMIGNIAEMVKEKGIAKGGSWVHTLEQSKIANRQYYTKPEAWLGFRCVCEVKKKY